MDNMTEDQIQAYIESFGEVSRGKNDFHVAEGGCRQNRNIARVIQKPGVADLDPALEVETVQQTSPRPRVREMP